MSTRKSHHNKNRGLTGLLSSLTKSDDDEQIVSGLRRIRDDNVERDFKNQPSTSAKSADEMDRSAERSGMAAPGDSGGDSELACAKCENYKGGNKWIACDLCDLWYHTKCVHLDEISEDNIKLMKWSCETCLEGCKTVLSKLNCNIKGVGSLNMKIEEMCARANQGLERKINDLSAKIDMLQQSMKGGNYDEKKTSYAEKTKKNLLVIHNPNGRIIEKKKEIAKTLESVQIVDTRFPKSGDIIVNLPDVNERDKAEALIQKKFKEVTTKKTCENLPENHDL